MLTDSMRDEVVSLENTKTDLVPVEAKPCIQVQYAYFT